MKMTVEEESGAWRRKLALAKEKHGENVSEKPRRNENYHR
jgi:hypothetical protein